MRSQTIARLELRELVGRVAAREHVEHVLELCAREVGERIGAADEVVQLADLDLLLRGDGDDLLREHVERVARDHRLLDLAGEHPLGDDRRLEQVGAELREHPPLRDRAELVAGAADALEAAGDRLRRLDLDHEVDRAHVDPELERRGGDQARDLAELEQLLDLDPLLARQRAVVGARDLLLPRSSFSRSASRSARRRLLTKRIVERCSSTSRRSSGYMDGQIEVDGVPSPPVPSSGSVAAPSPRLAHVLDRDDHLQVELLARAGVDDPDRPRPRHEPPDLLDRALRRGQADALDRLADEPVEPLDREREVRAALGARNGMHLVEDQRPDRLRASRGPAR